LQIERKFESWAPKETANLVQSYLKAIDELRALDQIYKQKLSFLNRLLKDCRELERQTLGNQTRRVDESMTMTGRVRFATTAVGDLHTQCDQLVKELTASLNLVSVREVGMTSLADKMR